MTQTDKKKLEAIKKLIDDFEEIKPTSILRPQLHLFKKMLDLDRKNKGLKPFRDSFLTKAGTEWVSY